MNASPGISLQDYSIENSCLGDKAQTLTSICYEFAEIEQEIDRSKLMPGKAHSLKSPTLAFCNKTTEWEFHLMLKLSGKNGREEFGLYVIASERIPADLEIEANFSLYGGLEWTVNFTFEAGKQTGYGPGKRLPKKVIMESLTQDGHLPVCVQIVLDNDFDPETSFNDFEGFLDSDFLASFSDFAMNASDGQEIRCLKSVLALRSPTFRSMLETKTCKEVRENKVEIKDFDAPTLKAFWRFLVTGNLRGALDALCYQGDAEDDKEDEEGEDGKREDVDEEDQEEQGDEISLCLDLLILGDKYNVDALTEQAGFFLAKKITTWNVLRILKVADLVNFESLIKFAINFISRNHKSSDLTVEKIMDDDIPKSLSLKIVKDTW